MRQFMGILFFGEKKNAYHLFKMNQFSLTYNPVNDNCLTIFTRYRKYVSVIQEMQFNKITTITQKIMRTNQNIYIYIYR